MFVNWKLRKIIIEKSFIHKIGFKRIKKLCLTLEQPEKRKRTEQNVLVIEKKY